MTLKKQNKKAQEEMVGFVLIVVIVVVIGLVFLLISARQETKLEAESKDISAFLRSASEYTSECAINYEPNYAKLGELIKECRDEAPCISGKKACEVLNATLSDILDKSWNVKPGGAIKGYAFNSTFSSNVTQERGREILSIISGNCSSGIIRGANEFYAVYPGTVNYGLKVCY